MSGGQERGRLDWLVELAGATAPALAALVAAAMLAPAVGWPMPILAIASGGGMFALAYVAMRAVPPEPRFLPLNEFAAPTIDDEELLLDQPWHEELLLDQPLAATSAIAELLLDDPLPAPAPEARVVQLFADGRMPTAGQLINRIDQHLAEGGRAAPPLDASDALSEALAELRRSLRQAEARSLRHRQCFDLQSDRSSLEVAQRLGQCDIGDDLSGDSEFRFLQPVDQQSRNGRRARAGNTERDFMPLAGEGQ
jgi:hypothetical protein